jgi:hypothetical protein
VKSKLKPLLLKMIRKLLVQVGAWDEHLLSVFGAFTNLMLVLTMSRYSYSSCFSSASNGPALDRDCWQPFDIEDVCIALFAPSGSSTLNCGSEAVYKIPIYVSPAMIDSIVPVIVGAVYSNLVSKYYLNKKLAVLKQGVTFNFA